LEDSEKVLEIEPEHVKSHLRRIKAKECLGTKNDAIKAIFEVLEKMPYESNFKQALRSF
jgi:DNA-directed RNA polymerase subunit F